MHTFLGIISNSASVSARDAPPPPFSPIHFLSKHKLASIGELTPNRGADAAFDAVEEELAQLEQQVMVCLSDAERIMACRVSWRRECANIARE